MAEILDSGDRTVFATGAVRDVQTAEKGRCDLLPLGEISMYLNTDWSRWTLTHDPLIALDMFQFSLDPLYAMLAVFYFCEKRKWDGPTAVLEYAKHMADGCRKYGPRNWELGIPVSRYLDSAIRHFLKWVRGDDDERHDRAFIWNLFCMVWTMNNRPECIDIEARKDGDG